MYGSSGSTYGSCASYSSLNTMTPTLDLSFGTIQSHDSSCAFPSWPRRSSLSESEEDEPVATSFLSDEDLWPSDPVEEDNRSLSSTGSSPSPVLNAIASPPRVTDEEFLRMECERVAKRDEYVRQIRQDKDRRRQASLKAKKSSQKRSPKLKQVVPLTTIPESSE
ncbi:hypothetical protein E4U52_001709 [Claviceps spartinae]|nr:hypothetical protein E4U52_001709 [Claviceps spartinae]KAG6087532.1 hypothetical protein E4U15_007764 [Claviceps sp. LM218 group G6]KAG6096416.1 hypothetical protein E4U30_001563 [Claviceps sp. LM220 group G6]KAG6112911.1 hypothetical protein E4U31_002130 [Claviceps sp. LM219 group G6]KAG6121454.1 hypothetical protein E4U14_001840 [Claviceps sp. LM454 group G7]